MYNEESIKQWYSSSKDIPDAIVFLPSKVGVFSGFFVHYCISIEQSMYLHIDILRNENIFAGLATKVCV